MRRPGSVRGLEVLGRVRLSASFFMRDFLHSEIADFHGIPNLPDHPDLAIAAGRKLCDELLEPLQATFGRLAIRSAYRAPAVNAFGNEHGLNCASNERNRGRHIWDQRDRDGNMGAMATVVLPWFADWAPRAVTGAPWPGGFMTNYRIANSSSFRDLGRSTSGGGKIRCDASTASLRRAAASRGRPCQTGPVTMPWTTPHCGSAGSAMSSGSAGSAMSSGSAAAATSIGAEASWPLPPGWPSAMLGNSMSRRHPIHPVSDHGFYLAHKNCGMASRSVLTHSHSHDDPPDIA
jgi:hypothetical protein